MACGRLGTSRVGSLDVTLLLESPEEAWEFWLRRRCDFKKVIVKEEVVRSWNWEWARWKTYEREHVLLVACTSASFQFAPSMRRAKRSDKKEGETTQ